MMKEIILHLLTSTILLGFEVDKAFCNPLCHPVDLHLVHTYSPVR